jgi:hypothetical protein
MFCCPRCSHLSTILNNVVEPESGVTISFNIVDSYEQCGQQNIVQSCFHQYCINLSVFTRVVTRNDEVWKLTCELAWTRKLAASCFYNEWKRVLSPVLKTSSAGPHFTANILSFLRRLYLSVKVKYDVCMQTLSPVF